MAYSYDLWLWPKAMAYSEESVQQSQRYRRIAAQPHAHMGAIGVAIQGDIWGSLHVY